VPWGQLSLEKMSTRDSPGGKGGRCVRLTTYHPCSAERQEFRGLNLREPPWAISTACCGRDLYLYQPCKSVRANTAISCISSPNNVRNTIVLLCPLHE